MKKADEALVIERGNAHMRAWFDVAERHGEVYHVTDNGSRSSLTYCCRFFTIDLPPFDELIVMTGMAKRPELVQLWPGVDDMSGLSCEYSQAFTLLQRRYSLDMKKRAYRGGGSGVFGILYGIAQMAGWPDAHNRVGKLRLSELTGR